MLTETASSGPEMRLGEAHPLQEEVNVEYVRRYARDVLRGKTGQSYAEEENILARTARAIEQSRQAALVEMDDVLRGSMSLVPTPEQKEKIAQITRRYVEMRDTLLVQGSEPDIKKEIPVLGVEA